MMLIRTANPGPRAGQGSSGPRREEIALTSALVSADGGRRTFIEGRAQLRHFVLTQSTLKAVAGVSLMFYPH